MNGANGHIGVMGNKHRIDHCILAVGSLSSPFSVASAAAG